MRKSRGFTLVELLVVIAVIGVLVAILLPALNRARDQAKLLMCLSNIRQIGMVAIGPYAVDYKGCVTPLSGSRAGISIGMPYLIFGPAGGWTASAGSIMPYNVNFADLIQLYLDPKNCRDTNPNFREYAGIFYCAADYQNMDGTNWGGGRPGWWANGYFREFSWRENYNVTPLVWDPVNLMPVPQFGRKISVKSPSEKVLFAESHYEAVNGDRWGGVNVNACGWGAGILTADPVNRNTRWSPPRHRTGFVASYFDGHARIVPFSERQKFCDDYPDGNWAVAGWGPNWDLDKP